MGTKTANIYLFLLWLLLLGCRGKDYECHIFIPDGYEGPVRIRFGIESSKNKLISYGDRVFFIVITGDPRVYEVCNDPTPRGYYTTHNYYYSTDTLYEINRNGMKSVLDSKYPITSNHASMGEIWHFWVDRDKNTKSKKDSLTKAAKRLWATLP